MKFDNYLLRPIEKKDVQGYFELIDNNRKRLEDFFAGTVAKNRSLEDTRIFVPEVIQKAAGRTYFSFVIIDTITNTIVGYTDIKNIDWNIPKAEIGYFIDKDYESKGIISKAVTKIIEYCFNELKLRKIFLRTHESNIGSIRIAEKHGFQQEGIIRSDYKTTSGKIIDVIYYGLLKKDQ